MAGIARYRVEILVDGQGYPSLSFHSEVPFQGFNLGDLISSASSNEGSGSLDSQVRIEGIEHLLIQNEDEDIIHSVTLKTKSVK